jgi:CRP-like cAMP-binding protein
MVVSRAVSTDWLYVSTDWLYVILEGRAKTRLPGGAAPRMLGAGDCFNELGVVDGASVATVVAVGSLQVMKLPRSVVVRRARSESSVSIALFRHAVDQLRWVEAAAASS